MHAIAEYPKTYTKSGEAVDEKRDGDIYVLGINQQDFQNDFNGKPTLISIQMTYDLGGGRSEVISDFPVQDNFVLKLADWSQNGANKTKYSYTLTSRVVVDTYNVATKMISNFNLDNTLVVSQQQFKEIAAKVGKGSDDVGIAAAAKLANSKNHQRVNDALRAQFPNAYTTDNIAEQNKQRSLMLGVRILIYGFIALLSLVSLATIVSHIFSTLLTSKRSLAMFQSVGMTAKQVTGMLGIQNAILLITGGVIGTGLGVGVSYGLFKMMNDYYLNHYLFPTTQIIVVGLMLLVVWAVFQIFIYRTVKAQDINELIRAE
ncbi:ABC transporter permease [Amylolactobacillus amylophilus]|nr:ABC transporter permease [Amylolactobacillus amylophilus]